MKEIKTRIKWTEDKLKEASLLLETGKTLREVAKILAEKWKTQLNRDALKNCMRDHGISVLELQDKQCVRIYDDFLCLPEDDYIVCCDFHSPFHNDLWLRRMDDVRKEKKVKKCIIAGDLFDMNFAKHWQNFEGEELTTLELEKEKIKPVLDVLDRFDKIYLIRGNHESRVTRQTNVIQANVVIDYMTKDVFKAGKFKYNYYSHCFIGNNWMAVHPQSYSQISGAVAVRLAEKFHKNILNAHGHFVALRYDRSGQYKCVDVGAMVDIQKVAYKNLTITTHPEWNNGFVALINGELQMYNDMINWK